MLGHLNGRTQGDTCAIIKGEHQFSDKEGTNMAAQKVVIIYGKDG